jgi:hypothetical protein
MKIYIANGTNQVQRFFYRVPGPEWSREIELVIPQGMQMAALSAVSTRGSSSTELLPEEGEAIIEHLELYGGVNVDTVDRVKPFAGLVYSIGKPVSPPKIEKVFNHNKKVLEKRTEDGLFATALANNKVLNDRIEETAHEARHSVPEVGPHRISITEIPRSGSPKKTNFFSNGKDKSGTIRMGNA